MVDSMPFNRVQSAAIELMKSDLRFLYTMIINHQQLKSNYIASSLPYMGLIVDGIEDWINRYNKSSKNSKLPFPVFSGKEQEFYENMRTSIKMWSMPYRETYERIEALYEKSKAHFSSLCIPFASFFKLYDIFGVDYADGEVCGNTIMCAYYSPSFSFDKEYGESLKSMSEIAGQYIYLFDAVESYSVDKSMIFSTKDFGGIVKSPVGNKFGDKFVLFSMLGQIQYLLLCVEQYIAEECSTKLRFEYILYYYLNAILPEINIKLNTGFMMDNKYHSELFRNAMAHYSLGVVLKPEDLVESDPFWGLTQKFFQCDYFVLKTFILSQLCDLSKQLKGYLHL